MSGLVVTLTAALLGVIAWSTCTPVPRLIRRHPWSLHLDGRLTSRLASRLPSLARVSDTEVVVGCGLSVALAVVVPPALFVGPVVLTGLAVGRARAAGRARDQSIARAVPDLVDLLSLAVGAGLSLPGALDIVRPWLPNELRRLIDDAVERIAAGAPLADALTRLRDDVPMASRRPLVVLIAATRDGAPLAASLERAAGEARLARRRAAETRNRKLPVLMLLPLVLCVLPAFVLLTLVPLVVGSLHDLSIADVFGDL